MPKYKKCPDCGGMAKYSAGNSKEQRETDVYKCTNKHCGKSYPASPAEKGDYQKMYPKPGK